MDILFSIQNDHDALKRMIPDLDRRSWPRFRALLSAHTEAEERVLLATTKPLTDLRAHTIEYLEEHKLIKTMQEKLEEPVSHELWTARAKVLTELLEHHLAEEEKDFFPVVEELLSGAERIELGHDYRAVREQIYQSCQPKRPLLVSHATSNFFVAWLFALPYSARLLASMIFG